MLAGCAHDYQTLLADSQRTHTDALIVVKEGKTLLSQPQGISSQLFELKSVTKSVVWFSVGLAIEEKKIPSLDTPVSHWLNGWDEGIKARVTLRHILTQTSGIEHRSADGFMASHKDRSKFVRESRVVSEPGTVFSYNNEAVQLLAEIILKATGTPIDRYLTSRIFIPLGITHWAWDHDKTGNVLAYTGLRMRPYDLALLGELILAGGQWNGKTIVSRSWIDQASQSGVRAAEASQYGLLWWVGRRNGDLVLKASGWLGQHLVVEPATGVVAVRMHAQEGPPDSEESENRKYGWLDFPNEVLRGLSL